jgi:hypothetical protein
MARVSFAHPLGCRNLRCGDTVHSACIRYAFSLGPFLRPGIFVLDRRDDFGIRADVLPLSQMLRKVLLPRLVFSAKRVPPPLRALWPSALRVKTQWRFVFERSVISRTGHKAVIAFGGLALGALLSLCSAFLWSHGPPESVLFFQLGGAVLGLGARRP